MWNCLLLLSGFHTWVCMCKYYSKQFFSIQQRSLFTIWIFILLFVKNMSTFLKRGINTLKPKPLTPMGSKADKIIVKKNWFFKNWSKKNLPFLFLLNYFVLSLFALLLLIREYFSTVYGYKLEEYLGTWEENIAFQLVIQLVFFVG